MSAHAAMSAPRHARLRPARSQTVTAQLGRAFEVLATVGSLVTLSALLVLAGAVGGLVDGAPAGLDTVTVTFDSPGHR